MKGKQLYLTGLQDANPPENKQYEVRLRLDALILSSVVMILLLALSFSLGVERGKRSLVSPSNRHAATATTPAPSISTKETLVSPQQTILAATKQYSYHEPEEAVTETVLKSPSQGYRIQVASFRKEDSARKETQWLRQKGYKAYHNRSGNYIVIYVGEYKDITTAKAALQLLRKKYKDCILKKL